MTGRISISVSVAQRQDQLDTTPSQRQHLPRPESEPSEADTAKAKPGDNNPMRGDCPLRSSRGGDRQLRLLGLGIPLAFGGITKLRPPRVFSRKGAPEERGTPLRDLLPLHHQPAHGRFASGSSSFSSPQPLNWSSSSHLCVTPDPPRNSQSHSGSNAALTGFEEEKEFDENEVEDEGIELPVLPRHSLSQVATLGQLPSPPDTPRGRVKTQKRPPNIDVRRCNDYQEDDDQVRIGVISPQKPVNLVRTGEDVFVDRGGTGRFEGVRGEVVDSAASEPGHGSLQYSREERHGRHVSDELEQVVEDERWNFRESGRRMRVLFSPLTTPIMRSRSPTFIATANPEPMDKAPVTRKSRSNISLSLSFGNGSLSSPKSPPTSPTMSFLSPSSALMGSGSRWRTGEKLREKLNLRRQGDEVGDYCPPTPGEVTEFGRGRKGHKRTGTWGSGSHISQTSPMQSKFSASLSAASTNTNSGMMEWYPFTSKSKSSNAPVLDVPPEIETADFMDMTDPFASPTPGFALPKWLGNNASAASSCGFGPSVSDVGHFTSGGQSTTSWSHCHGGGRVEKGKGRERERDEWDGGVEGDDDVISGGGGTLRSRNNVQSHGATWGRLPVVLTSPSLPPLPPPPQDQAGKIVPSILFVEIQSHRLVCVSLHAVTRPT